MAIIERKSAGGVLWLESELLSAPGGAAHGFSTRIGGVSTGVYASLNLGHTRGDDPEAVRENYRRFLAAAGAGRVERLVLSRQVHGSYIKPCTMADAGCGLDRERTYIADGLMTDVPGLALAVLTADCIPILFYDPARRVVAAVHAGWRGTVQGIAPHAVEQMCAVYGCDLSHIRAAIGPGIGACCFLCHSDVTDALRARWGSLAEPYLSPAEDGRTHVDLKGLNAAQLSRKGVELIEVSSACTGCAPEKYFHHRQTGDARGSMASVIMLREGEAT